VAGPHSTCAKISHGNIECWGKNNYGLYNSEGISAYPHKFNGQGNVLLSIGSDDTYCAVKFQGILKLSYIDCWGKCDGSMCIIPKGINMSMVDIRVGHDHVC